MPDTENPTDDDFEGTAEAALGRDDAPAEPQPRPQPAAPKPPQKPQHSPTILSLARQLGLTPQQIDSHTPAELDRVVEYLFAQRENIFQAIARDQPARQPQPATPAPEELDEVDRELPESEGYDKRLRDFLKRKDKEIAALKKEISEDRHARTVSTVKEKVDAAFAALGDDRFGAGGVDDLAADSKERKRRNAVLREAGIDFTKHPTLKQVQDRIKAAAADLYGDAAPATGGYEIEEPPPPKKAAPPKDPATGRFVPQDEIDRWDNAGHAVPTNRRAAPEKPGRRAAEKAAADYLKDQGYDVNGTAPAGEFIP